MTTQIIFTDRYGGNPPSWLRSCLECMAMGCSPEPCPRENGGGQGSAPVDPCPRPDEHLKPDFDGWHFLRCTDCNGSGRVSWRVTLARIPRWLVKGLAFCWQMSDQQYQPSHMSRAANLWLIFKCAFVYDLMRLWR
ncbi:MAG TPA: hypothetical protein VIV12_20375 [Streptosporangiaceae bacterium]